MRLKWMMMVALMLALVGCSGSDDVGVTVISAAVAETAVEVGSVAEPAPATVPAHQFVSGERVWIDIPGASLTPLGMGQGLTPYRKSYAEGTVVSVEGQMAKVQITRAELLGKAKQQAAYIKVGTAPFIPLKQLQPYAEGKQATADWQTVYTTLFYTAMIAQDRSLVYTVLPAMASLIQQDPDALAKKHHWTEPAAIADLLNAKNSIALLKAAKQDIGLFPDAKTVALQVMRLPNNRYAGAQLITFFQKSFYGSVLGITLKSNHIDNLAPDKQLNLGALIVQADPTKPRGGTWSYRRVPSKEAVGAILEQRQALVPILTEVFGEKLARTIPGFALSDNEYRDKVAAQLHDAFLYKAKKPLVKQPASEVYQKNKERIAELEDVLDRRPIITEQDFADLKATLDGKAK